LRRDVLTIMEERASQRKKEEGAKVRGGRGERGKSSQHNWGGFSPAAWCEGFTEGGQFGAGGNE